jgi:hypothetical protein
MESAKQDMPFDQLLSIKLLKITKGNTNRVFKQTLSQGGTGLPNVS